MLSLLRVRVATATSLFSGRTRRWFVGGWLMLLLSGLAAGVSAQTVYVTPTGAGSRRGSDWDNARPGTALPEILASAPAGVTVLVGAGLYKPTTTTDRTISFVIARGVELYGGYTAGTMTRTTNPSSTTLSGDIDNDNTLAGNSYHVVRTVGGNPVVDGLVITQGDARPLGTFVTAGGGGLFADNSSPTIRSVHFIDNAAKDGGGVFLNEVASATITNCLFSRNTATSGGGLYVNNTGTGSVTIADCRFLANPADGGGGVWNNRSNPRFTNCQFTSNTSSSTGGGMHNSISSPSLSNCSFTGNSATGGGGIYNDDCSPSLANCSFGGNTATNGGGMYNNGSRGVSSPSLANCSFAGNTASGNGGGMYNNAARGVSSPSLTNCSFGGNTAADGGGIYNDASETGTSSPSLTNCIIWANSSGVGNLRATPIYAYTDLQGNQFSTIPDRPGNRSVDPLFVDVANGNLQLSACSPLIDAGDNGVSVPGTDAAGNPRRQRAIDFGAFEFQGAPAAPVAITQQPASGSTVCAGTTVTVSVSTSGPVTGYQWYQNGTMVSGQTSATLSLPSITNAQSGSYSVVVTGSCNSVTSTAFSLTVTPQGPDYQPLADLYASTNGANWTNKTNWLANCDVCSWYGVTCTNGRVTGIDLTSNNLSGTLPASLSDLTTLQSLLLGTNQLTGPIPASLGTLPALQTLILFQNSLTGAIPVSLGTRAGLQVLNLSANQLEGTVPDALGNLTQLRVLNLGNNRLTGTLPASLSALTGVQAFDLSRNQLMGSIPAGYGALRNAIVLNINNNQLSGCFPTSLTALCSYGPVVERIPTPGSLSGARRLAGGTNNKVDVTSNAGLPGGGDFDSFCATDAGSCAPPPVATPVITTQPPAASAVCVGASVRASVEASGSNLTYQWYKAGTLVSGQMSATLTLDNVSTNQAGSYQAVVSSGTSSVTSTAFSLTVDSVPAVSVSPSSSTVCAGQTVTLSATPGLASYRWSNGQMMASIAVTATGTYSVTAITTGGCSNTASASVTVNPRPAAPYLTSVSRTLYTTNFPIPLIIYALPTNFGLDLRFYQTGTNTRIDPPVIRPTQPGTFDYYATQTDNKGCVSVPAAFSLKVLEGGTLVSKPADRSVCTGSSTVLSVTATGGNLKYSWYEANPDTPLRVSEVGSDTKNGKTANLTVNNVRQTKLYYCLVIGDKGIGVAGPIKVSVQTNCGSGARIAAGEPGESLQVRVLGNPVTGHEMRVEVRGAEGQPLRLQLTNLQGRTVSEQAVERAGSVEHQTLSLGSQPSGMLLLRVSTPTQSQTVKVLKAE